MLSPEPVADSRVADKLAARRARSIHLPAAQPLAVGNPAAKRPQGCLCGHFAVTEPTEQPGTQANSSPRSPVLSRFSPVFADFRGSTENRGDRI
jgi:hypothetical protein